VHAIAKTVEYFRLAPTAMDNECLDKPLSFLDAPAMARKIDLFIAL